jgi:hypothetical protein
MCFKYQWRTLAGEDAVGAAGVVEHRQRRVQAEAAVSVAAVGRASPMRVVVDQRSQSLHACQAFAFILPPCLCQSSARLLLLLG